MATPQPPPHIRPWAALAYRDFLFLWAGTVSMSFTSTLRILVSGQWLYEETGSAAQLGLLGVVQLVQLPVGLYGGTLADRINRKKLMFMTQCVAFTMLLALTMLAASGSLRPWHIFAVTGISGIVNNLGSSARPAMLPRVVPRDLLTHAVTTQIATRQVSIIIAPLIFWQVFERFGVSTAYAIAMCTAAVSMTTPVLIRASGQPEGGPARTTVNALKEGYRFVMGHRLLPGLYLLDIGVVMVSFYRQLFPVFADHLYGMGAAGTGMLNTADALGGILGTYVVLHTNRYGRKGLLVLVATLAYALLLFAFGINRILSVGLVIIGGLGIMDAVSMAMRQAIVQLTTPDRLLGRASSAHSFAAMGANHLGQIEVGVLSGAIGAGNTMIIGGMISLLVVMAIWHFMPGISRHRYDPEHPYETPDGSQ